MPVHAARRNGKIAPGVTHTVAVDAVLFTIEEDTLKVLCVRRDQAPYLDRWALPGGRVEGGETIDAAAIRILKEKTAVSQVYLEQLYTFGSADRDPRGPVITVAYYALVSAQQQPEGAAAWFPVKDLPALAFDHEEIVAYATGRLQNKINYTTVACQLLPPAFTLTELQLCYEVILDKRLDKRNFRRKMLQLGILKATRQFKMNGRQRPARLYAFREPSVIKLQERGILVPF